MKNRISNLYHTLFQSRESQRDESLIRDFITAAQRQEHNPYEMEDVDRYLQNPQFVEKAIIEYILKMENIKLDMEYISLYARQMNASAVKTGSDKVIFVDELLTYTTLSYFLTVFSYAYDSSEKNTERCVNNFISLLQIQGKEQAIGVHDLQDILEMITLPRNIVDMAMDCYWTAWSFTIGHELYHLITESHVEPIREEYDADTFGYMVLLHMIKEQKEGRIPGEIRVYYESIYLSPIMLFEYFSLFDEYRSCIGKVVLYSDHPSPKGRQEHIFDMFEDIPDGIDTEEGNEVLNIFLDSADFLKGAVFQRLSLTRENNLGFFKFMKQKQSVKGSTGHDDFDIEDYDEDEPEADDTGVNVSDEEDIENGEENGE